MASRDPSSKRHFQPDRSPMDWRLTAALGLSIASGLILVDALLFFGRQGKIALLVALGAAIAQVFSLQGRRLWRTQRALEEAEAKFATIFRTSPDPVAILTLAEGRLLEVNDSLVEFVGYSRADLLGRTALELNLWHEPATRQTYLDLIHRQGQIRNLEVQVHTQPGAVKTGLLSAEVQVLEGQTCVIAVLRDITERHRHAAALQRTQARLRKTEQWLEQYSQVSPSMIYTFVEALEDDVPGRPGGFEYISAALEEIGEISVDVGLQDANAVRRLIHPDDVADYLVAELASAQTLSPFSHQCRIVTPSGRVKWIHNQSQPQCRADGMVAWHGVVVDISLYKQAEAALQKSETLLRQLAEAVKEGFFVYDVDADEYAYVNSAYWQIRGTDPNFGSGSKAQWLACIHADDRDRIVAALARERQGEPFDEEYRYTTPDGELRWLHSKAFPLLDDGGNVVRVVGTVENITDRKLTEAALRQSEARFRSAFNDAPYGISLVDTEGRFVLANAYYCALLGYSEAELLTLTFQDITHPDDWADDWAGFQAMMGGKTATHQIQKRHRTKQGTEIPVIVSAAPIYDIEGKPLYSVGHVQDMRDRLAVDRMKDEFISVVSHELRTPITAIQGALALLGAGVYAGRPEKARHMLDIAIANSDRLVRLVNDILSFERLESGQVQLEKERCQVSTLLYQAIDSVQPMADQSGITIALTPLAATLWAAPDGVIQVLTNLLSNAIKFSSPKGTVWLEAREWEGGDVGEPASQRRRTAAQPGSTPPPLPPATPAILFSVTDHGRGIPANKLETIFEQFQQVDVSDSRQRGGTGLGLAICKRIVQQHRGRIWVESAVGKGSTFYVALPLGAPGDG